ncbi:MAG: gamma-glutamylcyclotransferase family protein [Terriglobales bacterium]
MSRHLFVYGTLEPAHAPAEIAAAVRHLRRVGSGSVRGRLYDLGDFPGAVVSRTSPSVIKGKVFELPEDEQVLSSIDTYEGFDPNHPQGSLFVRKRWPVTLADGSRMTCWIYTYNRKPGDARLIPSGSYTARKGSRKRQTTSRHSRSASR